MAEQAWRPRPCVTHTGGPGRPGFPSALTMKGRRLRAAGTVRMKGGESRPDHGDESLRFGPDKHGPGVEDATVERRRAACLAKARGTARCQTEMVRHFGAPLPHVCEGKGNDGGPHADQTTGPMNHACLRLENFARERGLFDN